ncbi:MAG: alpha/beta fold hydrolase [Alphaproteobacteria bacterium]|nr:alpha/beta fold hydrolase [Alphaproteobacteria bacterium]
METYKAEFAQKQQAAADQTSVPKAEPLQTDPGKRGVISTNPETPDYPDRGNFADKLWGGRVKAKPFVDDPRKGTYYFGGAGMDGAYIGDMVKAMQENGVGNAKAVDPAKWTDGEKVDAAMTLLRRNQDGAQTEFSQFGKEGKQFNMVGYSHGGSQAAQAAADYAAAGGKVDHLVLVGTPISQEFLDRLKSNPNIGKVVVKDIEGQGDPIRAGMSAGEQIRALPKLVEDMERGRNEGRSIGHFYYAGEDAIRKLRRRELSKQLYEWGLR